MQKATLKKGILLLVMAASLCLNFTTTHSASADPPANDRKVAVVTFLGDSFSAGNGAGDYYSSHKTKSCHWAASPESPPMDKTPTQSQVRLYFHLATGKGFCLKSAI